MNDSNVRRLTAAFGVAIVALNWAMFPLYLIPGPPPAFQDTASYLCAGYFGPPFVKRGY